MGDSNNKGRVRRALRAARIALLRRKLIVADSDIVAGLANVSYARIQRGKIEHRLAALMHDCALERVA